jgi:cobaltochelatase CobS
MSADTGAKFTNGRGDKIPKHKDFMVVGAGNTDMKSTSVNFSGNNRQDYSLVDRFSGSMYRLNEDPVLEMSLTYTAVYNIAIGLRAQLPNDSIEAITLRSMLNFNRVYQMQMLRLADSFMAFYPVGTTDEQVEDGSWLQYGEGKTLKDSINSFIDSLGEERATEMRGSAKFKSIIGGGQLSLDEILVQATEHSTTLFEQEFERVTGFNFKTGKNKNGVLWNATTTS